MLSDRIELCLLNQCFNNYWIFSLSIIAILIIIIII